jgi:hypothetical protein
MNIFYLHENPYVSAVAMTNKHVVKMIVESAQLLSTAHHVLDGTDAIAGIYKPAYVNHPCAVWVRETMGNYLWLVEHLFALLNEYAIRYGKMPEDHATHKVAMQLINLPKKLVKAPIRTPMRLAITNVAHHVPNNPVQSYRNYYVAEKLRTPEDIKRYNNVLG